MKEKRFEFVLQADAPIAHSEGTIGNSSVLMRQKVRLPGGRWAKVPYITGDTMRHGLREAGAWAYLDAAGLVDDPSLTESALRLLFAGGMVTKLGPTVNLEEFRRLAEICPPLGLLGGCAQNRVIEGQVHVDEALLICSETQHLFPQWLKDWLSEQEESVESARKHVNERTRVRMDPALSPGKRELLLPESKQEIQQRLLAGEIAAGADDAKGKEAAKSTNMPRNFEVVERGSLFYWSIQGRVCSELQEDTFMVMLGAFLSHCQVGGKKATGHGMLKPVHCRQVHVRPVSQRTEVFSLSTAKIGDVFRAHCREKAGEIRDFLGSVAA
ncbi:MAG TPA: hypothetical protein VLV83_11565 [Acidobacteriota bacterium]|nr:hypothetical protein [Acidobacteriota bacterium]